MRRVLPAIAVLAVALAVGCSRQPQWHVGEWETIDDQPIISIKTTFHFLKEGKVQKVNHITVRIPGEPPGHLSPSVSEGKYKFDYSKQPILFDVPWNAGPTQLGIVRFIGEGSQQMQVCLSSEERPSSFFDRRCYLMTKKVKK